MVVNTIIITLYLFDPISSVSHPKQSKNLSERLCCSLFSVARKPMPTMLASVVPEVTVQSALHDYLVV